MKTIQAGFIHYRTTLTGLAGALALVYSHGGFNNLHGDSLVQAIVLVVIGFLLPDAAASGAPGAPK